ncbi:UvrABC system protein like [Actinidia chinensis var. chinensis]|uniref:UvrABC system protein like n=1 Tax=Actinidia chinensis var. chinensis TaxID=1590841 RepID=A0A2R6R417_ACTCC|nr:UvrABC system protein like [Actinidia chinensis var. chinensis]
MNALDSQLEALAFNYLSFGFSRIVSNIWAWVVVVSAAVNFWLLSAVRIVSDAAGSADQPTAVPTTAPKAVLAAVVETTTEGMTRGGKFTKALIDQPTIVSTTVTRAVVAVVETIEGTTRGGKFRVFYEGEEVEGEAKEGGDNFGGFGAVVGVGKENCHWCEDWNRMLVMRMGDIEWYRYQDLTVLNGNVVRLWDGCRKN